MGLIDATPRKLSRAEWLAKDEAFRLANPHLAPDDDASGGLLGPVDGGTQGEKPGGKGYDYGAMSKEDFNSVAQNRANAGFVERNAPGLVAGMIPGGGLAAMIGGWMDDRNFANEQSKRGAEFTGLGQMMPDEMMQFGPTMAGPAIAPGDAMGSGDIWQGNDQDLAGSIGEQPGMYAKGGVVRKPPKGLLDPPGPDDQIAAVKTGERILNAKQYGALSKEARAEVDRVLKAKK